MDYELYHDESKVDGYWHGILLVPVVYVVSKNGPLWAWRYSLKRTKNLDLLIPRISSIAALSNVS